ncbi:MAG TPA: membrane protein insertase YidC [Gammaproteobacteria bacterium]|nr:membrane protein insertase YidC [Gammaproteobacteria bacterium]
MENQRLFIFIALVFLGMLLYQAWERDYGEAVPGSKPVTTTVQAPSKTASSVPSPAQATNDVPAVSQPAKPAGPTISGESNKLDSDKKIRIQTDSLVVVLDTLGGDIRQVKLRKFPVALDRKDDPFVLMTDKGSRFFVAQNGFAMSKGKGPNHESRFKADKLNYVLSEGQEQLKVNLTWSDPGGIKVTKTYTFHRASYLIDLDVKVENNSGQDWQGSFYRQQQRTHYADEKQSMMVMRTYMGGVIYTPENLYEKISFSDMQDKNLNRTNIKGGWAGMMQHYFLAVWIPEPDTINSFSTSVINYRYYVRIISALETIASGQGKDFKSKFYAGPKDQNVLENISPGLELTADYGFLTVLAKPLFWLMTALHKIFNNWGWSIIFMTLIVKLLFFKLSEKSYKSMANMRKLQPRMQALKERYGDDKQAMNKGLMELYKKEKINPLGGCLPILVQIPVFIALYWVLLEAVELRQAPFMLWITDMSAKDPYFVLPLLMGATMFIQQRLNPAPMDPVQAKVMMALPVIFTVFFLFFPAGLVLYWVVNNSLSIAQQWVITKRVGAAK